MSLLDRGTLGKRWKGGEKLAALGFVVALAAALIAIGAGLGNRFGAWSFREGFAVLGWVVYVGAAGAALSLLGIVLVWRGGARTALLLALIGLVVGAATVWLPYQSRVALRASPRLSDITTDMVNPPAFVAAIALRKQSKARNPVTYSPAKAKLQAEHYPDIKPVMLAMPPDAAFERALATVKEMGWTVTATDKAAGRIEAYDQTLWFGFIDDVVVRVAAAGSGSRIDVRSSSRVGRREAGFNARRVRKLMAALRQAK